MRSAVLLSVLALTAPFLAGCSEPPAVGTEPQPFPLVAYRFTWEGADVAVDGTVHGWLLSVHNPTQVSYETTILPFGLEEALLGPVRSPDEDGGGLAWLPARIEEGRTVPAPSLTLGPGEGGVFLVKVEAYESGDPIRTGVRFLASPVDESAAPVEALRLGWNVTLAPAATAVTPGDHVRTVTVGVWANGTGFYTNSPGLLADPAFPYPENFSRDGGEPLPVYVYGEQRDEQPAASRDRCWYTTIAGYNGLLKTQNEGSTGVAFLFPGEAYTREGNEMHPLYGDALVFLNTVVAHEGATAVEDQAPDPTGACFEDRVNDTLDMLPLPGY